MSNKCIILVDGSNFYFKLRDLGLKNLLEFDFQSFSKFLADNSVIVSSTYYIGKVRNTNESLKTKQMFDNQQRLLSHLQNNNYKYSLGYLLKSGGKYHEKGVDVNLAVDILVTTYEKIAQTIYLVSSDTDLLPAIRKAQEKGVKVNYVGFSHKPSVALVAECRESKLLSGAELRQFLNQDKNKSRK